MTDFDGDIIEDVRIPEEFRISEPFTVKEVGESFPEYVRGCLVT